MIDLPDALRLMHPAIAVAIVFPIIGMTLNMAWQARQRRLQTVDGGKSKIPPVVGPEHLKLGRVLAGAVVGICLLGLLHPTIKYIIKENLWDKDRFQVITLALLGIATIASLVFLYQARERIWRGVFATLTGMGVVILGLQDKVFNRQGFGAIFRRDDEWFVSHFYSGILATMLMIFSLAIIQDIYQDRSNRWRLVHTVLNSIAIFLFLGQAMTGVRDLLEIPLGWQEPTIYGCDFKNKVCPPFKQSSSDVFQNYRNL
ncbi:DUF4079 domain-containing protein [Pseudanabaena sp. PCC 6802]|uniref:DUF4079 domain-containing protein n=1 Tax=Pseudanabaena sp. PCC 6802 TaxID=118173 RepID=UPI000349A010|nr:DUF4079 domain-containing protein [Pseudanabaena sp. PCC 6802]